MSRSIDRVLIIGAGLGGLRTAQALRHAEFSGEIILVGREVHLPYDRPPLSKQLLSGAWETDRIALTDEAALLDLDVELILGQEVVELRARRAVLQDGSTIDADAVVICTGLRARLIPNQSDRFHTLRTVDDALALKDALEDAQSLLVIGAGFIGAEISSTAVEKNISVTIVEAFPVPFEVTMGPDAGKLVARMVTESGVDLRCGTTVSGFIDSDAGVRVVLGDGSELRADVGVVGIGGIPDIDFLDTPEVRSNNGLECDASGRVIGSEQVWALGDVAAWYHPEKNAHIRAEHWNSVVDQAKTVAASITGVDTPKPATAYFWSDQFGLKIQVFGHPGDADSTEQLHGTGMDGGPVKGTVVGHFKGDALVAVTGFGAPARVIRYKPAVDDELDRASVLELAGTLSKPVVGTR